MSEPDIMGAGGEGEQPGALLGQRAAILLGSGAKGAIHKVAAPRRRSIVQTPQDEAVDEHARPW